MTSTTYLQVRQVYRTPYFNRLKQFFIRLIRNNLYIGKSTRSDIPQSCFICAKHPEKRIPIMFSCEIVKQMTLKLINILKEAGLLGRGDKIEIFLFREYDFNSVENLILITLWDFIYKARFSPEKHSTCMFEKYLQYKVDRFTPVANSLKLRFLLISNVLKRNNDHGSDT